MSPCLRAISERRLAAVATSAVCAMALVAPASGDTLAAWTAVASSVNNQLSAAPDWVAPTVTESTVALTNGKSIGTIGRSTSYYVYANVTDDGNPPSGIAPEAPPLANVDVLTTGASAVALAAGTYGVGGTTYAYRSAALTAGSGLAHGPYTYTHATTDVAGNSQEQTGFPVSVDAVAPTSVNVQTTNGGLEQGRAEQGDQIVYTFSEAIDAESILASWDGSGTGVVVRGAPVGNGANVTSIWTIHTPGMTQQLPLGSVDAGKHLSHNNGNVTFGASGTASTMVLSGATLTITLGTIGNGAAIHSQAANAYQMTWSPAGAVVKDLVGNSATTTAANEGGALDSDF